MPEIIPYHAGRMAKRRGAWKYWLIGVVSLVVLLFGAMDLGIGVEQRSVLWPWIDTKYASGYSERSFKKIKVGMTQQQVDALMMSRPLYVDRYVSGYRYSYTGDGRCSWGDFAWAGREVRFDHNGKVVEIFCDWYQD